MKGWVLASLLVTARDDRQVLDGIMGKSPGRTAPPATAEERHPMRIAAVVHNGVKHDARVLKGAASLKSVGHDVRIFGLTPGETEDFLLENGIPVHLEHRDLSGLRERMATEGLDRNKENSIWTSFRTQGDLVFDSVRASFKPDTVHIHDHLALTAASKYKEEFSCPIVWDAHEIYEDLASIAPERAAVNTKILRENAKYVDGFITLNRSIANYYRDKYPELPQAVLVPNAADRTTRPKYDGRMHEKAGLDSDQQILLFQGGLAANRGISALLESSANLNHNWTLLFMGWGALEGEIQAVIDRNADHATGRPRVAMIPGAPHSELLQWTSGATLGTIPYENTGLNHLYCSPNKLWEYPAAGVPILATDLPEMKGQIEKYQIGVTVPRNLEPAAISDLVNSLTRDQLQDLVENCHRYTEIENWTTFESRIQKLHEELGGSPEVDHTFSEREDAEVPKVGSSLWARVANWISGKDERNHQSL